MASFSSRHAWTGQGFETAPRRTRRFSFSCAGSGEWTVEGARAAPRARFGDLPSALAFARADSGAEEALIELRVGGLYVCVHQKKGWPHRICAPAA